jgi:hypothetical protein
MIVTDTFAKTLRTSHKRDANVLIAFLAKIAPII